MFNYAILSLASLFFLVSLITVIAEPLTGRNTAPGRFFRFFRIRCRDFSLMNFCVIAPVLLILGLAVGDDNFRFLWTFIGILLLTLIILHEQAVFCRRRKRKKAGKLILAPLTPILPETDSSLKLLKELPELETTSSDSDATEEQKG